MGARYFAACDGDYRGRHGPPSWASRARPFFIGGVVAVLLGALPSTGALAQADFTDLSLEELMDVEVTTVARRAQSLANTAAAVFVIGPEDIRRSGATNIPELLRMVPGAEVARIDANKWAVSIRGFNGRFADKSLVMIDGVSVYTPYFANVFWDVQDVVLEDIERIEVVRGPGGSVWGANAVNGVINVITKSSKDTQGVLLSGGGGTQGRAFATARYGGRIDEATTYRGSIKGFAQGDGGAVGDARPADAWDQGQASFRVDSATASGDPFSLLGRLYTGNYGTTAIIRPGLTPPFVSVFDDRGDVSGGSVLGRWRALIAPEATIESQAYYQRDNRKEMGLIFNLDTIDLDIQPHYDGFDGHALSGGLGYRFIRGSVDGNDTISFDPVERTDHLFSAFVQDEIALVRDRLTLTLGAKVEHNDSTGFEFQPSARMIWTPNHRHSLWAAVARAVRTPTIAEDDIRLNAAVLPPGAPGNPGPIPVVLGLRGDRNLEAEKLYAFEAGYRVSPVDALSLDFAAFVNVFDELRTYTARPPSLVGDPPPPHVLVPFGTSNDASGTSHGFELAARWTAAPWWRLNLAYTYLDLDFQDGGDLGAIDEVQGSSPNHQFSLRSMMDLGGGWELDIWPRYVGELKSLDIDEYVTLDARLGWRPTDNIELSFVGQNLLNGGRKEFDPELVQFSPTKAERGVYGGLTLTF